ncbi:uncharacterized protein LOC126177000 [Schistocerca cancellata]|uniref:uncharacterized protein LOC126177000 n=1 Tax=Schistocerca cancellata TaxID=274614 RepID=UPI0021193E17|nr:uncharacterized protein LOC126177000 [Schistocerca cancellata]
MAAAGCRTRCAPLLTQLLLQLLLFAALWAPTPKGGARALRLVRVRVPPLVARGMTARLECRFELQRDRLYSVTWYKDHEEFYRYVPRAPTPQHSYRLEGVRVVDELSDSQQVILRSVSLRATGVYRCEVSAEAPSFTSVHGEGHMQVVSLPHEGPEISGEVGGVFRQGDVLALNCTSGRSSPPARIRWFVNDRQVPPALEASVQQHGLTATVSGLRLVVSERHFSADGRLRVRCQATVTAGGGPDAEPLVETREALVVAQGSAGCARPPPLRALLLTSLLAALLLVRGVSGACA